MFYVYILARPDGRPFYVGKGQNERIFDHEQDARRGRLTHKCNIIRKIWRNGGEVQRYIVFTSENEAEALAYEQETISLIGREHLANRTGGGESPSFTREQIRQRGLRTKRLWKSSAYRAKVSAAIRESWASNTERRILLAQWARARWEDPQIRARMIAHIWNDDHRAKVSQINRMWWTDPTNRKRAIEERRRRWQDPQYRERTMAFLQSEANRERQRSVLVELRKDPAFVECQRASAVLTGKKNIQAVYSPEARRKHREAMQSPELRQQRAEAARQRWADPEFRARMLPKLEAARAASPAGRNKKP